MSEYTKEEGKELIKLARQAIESELYGKELKFPKNEQLLKTRGVFVTLTKHGELRGCIGFPLPTLPLAEAVVKVAKSAAFSDPRFLPITDEEFEHTKIEISVLTLPKETEIKDIKIGRDGLICEYMAYSGLLLPQVATEHKMDKEEFLSAVCEKAGLPRDIWKEKNIKFKSFQAQIFKE